MRAPAGMKHHSVISAADALEQGSSSSSGDERHTLLDARRRRQSTTSRAPNSRSTFNPYLGVCMGLTAATLLSLLAFPRNGNVLAVSVYSKGFATSEASASACSKSLDRLNSPLALNSSSAGASLELPGCGPASSVHGAAAPWLLPPLDPCLPYTGLTDLLQLAKQRSRPKGRYKQAVSISFFSESLAEMTQNAIFSMVKFGGVDNYLVATWTPEDLAACQHLNLPCADASSFLPRELGRSAGRKLSIDAFTGSNDAYADAAVAGAPEATMDATEAEGLVRGGLKFQSRDYNTIVWAKPAVVLKLLELGYVVHSTDVDLGESYLSYIESVGADLAMQTELGNSPVNSGNFVILPTMRAQVFMRRWMRLAGEKLDHGGNQKGLALLHTRGGYTLCETVKGCAEKYHDGKDHPALLRMFRPPWFARPGGGVPWEGLCALSGNAPPPAIDPCHPMLLFVHPVCTQSGDRNAAKARVIKEAGFWFMGECRSDENEALPRCQPLEDAGRGFELCKSRLGLAGQLY